MSAEDAELVREIFDAVGQRGDLEVALSTAASTIEWDMSGVAGWPEEQVYRGPEAVRAFLEGWKASWTEWHFETERLLDFGETVFVGIREWGIGGQSGVSVEQRRFLLWTIRDGQTVRVRMFSDEVAARSAANDRP